MSTWVGYLVGLNELWRRHGFEPTPREFADFYRMPVGRAKVALLRLSRMGLARRRKDPRSGRTKRPYRYRPSKRGALEASSRGTEPAVVDELHQIEQIEELKTLVKAGRPFAANQFYVTRRKGWSGIWRHAVRQLLIKMHVDRDRAEVEELAAAVQAITKRFEGTTRAPEPLPSASKPFIPRDVLTDRFSRRADHRPSAGCSCDISSHLPLGLRGRASHIVLEPAINPVTGEFLLDCENRLVYNQLYEPWEPERTAESARSFAATAVACGVIVGALQTATTSARYQARVATLEAEIRGLRSQVSSKTREARIFEEMHRLDLVWMGHMQEIERSRNEDRVVSHAIPPPSRSANALLVTEDLALVDTVLWVGLFPPLVSRETHSENSRTGFWGVQFERSIASCPNVAKCDAWMGVVACWATLSSQLSAVAIPSGGLK